MVSIPDWTKLGRLFDAPKEAAFNPNTYFKQREIKALKQAEDHGYFLNVSQEYIKQHLYKEEEPSNRRKSVLDKYTVKEKDLGKIKIVKLASSHLRTIGDIGFCTNLQICVLSGNYLSKFDALISCPKLVKLDLHSNQISTLPSHGFWMCLRRLQILHLHDNPIGNLEHLQSLSSCHRLVALTLFDTPLSLKKNYRHHVVNSIFTLKALDSYVISDEEIIEDADFGSYFCSLHPNFSIDLCPPVNDNSTYEEERDVMMEVLAEINYILSHNSPVLMIQKYIRGFIQRRKFDNAHLMDPRFQHVKNIRHYGDLNYWQNKLNNEDNQTTQHQTPRTKMSMDYDTYILNRRPGSQGVSERSLPPISKQSKSDTTKEFDITYEGHSSSSEKGPRGPTPTLVKEDDGRRHIYINLAKLQMSTIHSLHEDSVEMANLLSAEPTTRLETKSRREAKRPRPKPKEEKKKTAIKSVRQFFGPVVQNVPTPEPVDARTDEIGWTEEEEIPRINFRLKGFKEPVKLYDPVSEMVCSKQEVGVEIRAGEDEYHHKKQLERKPVVEKRPKWTTDKKLFNRAQGTMGMSCLWAVHHAYRDRERSEKRALKLEHTMNIKEQREIAKERIKMYHEEKKAKVAKERERDSKNVLEVLEKRELARVNYIGKNTEQRQISSQHMKKRKEEQTFLTDFNTQNTSVSNALLRHDRQARYEDQSQQRADLVSGLRDSEKEQSRVVSKYLEHRQLMRQTETAMQRAALDTKMLQEASDRVMEAKTRVQQKKNRSATVEQFYPLPSVSAHGLPPLTGGGPRVVVDDLKGLDRFHTEVYMKQGRIGRHHTSVV